MGASGAWLGDNARSYCWFRLGCHHMEGLWELGWVGWSALKDKWFLTLLGQFTDPSENPVSDKVDSSAQKKKSTNTHTCKLFLSSWGHGCQGGVPCGGSRWAALGRPLFHRGSAPSWDLVCPPLVFSEALLACSGHHVCATCKRKGCWAILGQSLGDGHPRPAESEPAPHLTSFHLA